MIKYFHCKWHKSFRRTNYRFFIFAGEIPLLRWKKLIIITQITSTSPGFDLKTRRIPLVSEFLARKLQTMQSISNDGSAKKTTITKCNAKIHCLIKNRIGELPIPVLHAKILPRIFLLDVLTLFHVEGIQPTIPNWKFEIMQFVFIIVRHISREKYFTTKQITV